MIMPMLGLEGNVLQKEDRYLFNSTNLTTIHTREYLIMLIQNTLLYIAQWRQRRLHTGYKVGVDEVWVWNNTILLAK